MTKIYKITHANAQKCIKNYEYQTFPAYGVGKNKQGDWARYEYYCKDRYGEVVVVHSDYDNVYVIDLGGGTQLSHTVDEYSNYEELFKDCKEIDFVF